MPSSSLATGEPIADISAGWDGTLWAVDSLGIPHVYDPLQQSWQTYGKGVDAAAKWGDALYLFSGADVAIYDLATSQVTLQTIATLWPDLPPSFTSHLDGASCMGGQLVLFRGGRCVAVANPAAVQTLSELEFWPSQWADGVVHAVAGVEPFDGVYQFGFPFFWPPGDTTAPVITCVCYEDAQFGVLSALEKDFSRLPLHSALRDVLEQRFDAYIEYHDVDPSAQGLVFQGPVVWKASSTQPITACPLGSFVPLWSPSLCHAPRGRVGNLWSVTTEGSVVYHNGEGWNPVEEIVGATVLGVDVGEDDVPFALVNGESGAAVHCFDAETMSWQSPLSLGAITPQQLSVGDASRVYVLDSDGVVNRLNDGTFAPVQALPAGITHISANHDGTLWHSDGSADAFRFISELPYPPQSLPVGSTVQKVGSTGYGNALLLVNDPSGASQLYTYESPYVFKTSPSFVPTGSGTVGQSPQVAAGNGRCYINLGSGIVALDSHTGQERWSIPLPNQGTCQSILYDPVHDVLYATDATQLLYALDAATGEERWWFQVATGPISQPALMGGGLCVVGNNTVYWLNRTAALAQPSGQSVTPVWQTELNTSLLDNGTLDPAIVFLGAGTVYVTLNNTSNTQSNGQQIFSLNAADGGNANQLAWGTSAPTALYVPVFAFAYWGIGVDWTAFTNKGGYVQYDNLRTGAWGNLFLPDSLGVAPSLLVDQNTLFVGGSDGNLYGLDLTQDVSNGPQFLLVAESSAAGNTSFCAGPIVVPSSAGSIIAYSTKDNSTNKGSIWIYQPPATTPMPGGNLIQLETDHLIATQLTVDENGILYATGQDPVDGVSGQVYALRVNTLLQQERAFIIESQLMQDFDAPSGQLTTTARYQTHVSIVESVDTKQTLRPLLPVKVWADTAITVLIDGVSHAIDTHTAATVKTDASGTLTIVSDATDLVSPALKLWAGFMDPHERIVIYPDREFHQRLATTHYDTTTSPDPTTINLATASTYTVTNLNQPPPALYNTPAQQQGAQAVAPAVQQFASSVAYPGAAAQGAAPAAAGRVPFRDAAAAPTEVSEHILPLAPRRYLADACTGAFYAPASSPAPRQVAAAAATGFSIDFSAFHNQSGPPIYTPLSVADAANSIDALSGTSEIATASFGSWWSYLWHAIEKEGAKVAHVVVSVGREIYLGLKLWWKDTEQVFRHIIHSIEDVARAIGSALVALGRVIDDVIQGLSIIFHLDQVLYTAQKIGDAFESLLDNLQTMASDSQGMFTILFDKLNTDVAKDFNKIIADLQSGQMAPASASSSIIGLQGMGSTPNSVFSVGPKNSGQKSSQAVPGMWGIHKLRHNYRQASQCAAASDSDNTLEQLVQTQLNLFQASGNYSHASTTIKGNTQYRSADDFFKSLLADLLTGLEHLVEDVLAVFEDLVNLVLNNPEDLVQFLRDVGNVEIPVLSAIWHELTGKPLTFLDVLIFVIAIPVTLIYRVIEGAYPQEQLSACSAASDTNKQILARVNGVSATINTVLYGILNAISDLAAGIQKGVPVLGKLLIYCSSLTVAFNTLAGDVLTPNFYVITSSIISLVDVLLNLPFVPSEEGSILCTCLTVGSFIVYVLQYEEYDDALNLASSVVGTLPTVINPIKFFESAWGVAPVADVVCALAVAGMTLDSTITSWDDPAAFLPQGS
ncbi:PQQ-binding-like beta-propeller repeat protein [Cyanobium sp. FGCU-6]|nr:PQQ-binding-like beta-propeller repeat protein [Cyanobium sp. FGCU6]